MTVWTVLLVMTAVACCATCVYGISTAVRRSHQRRDTALHS